MELGEETLYSFWGGGSGQMGESQEVRGENRKLEDNRKQESKEKIVDISMLLMSDVLKEGMGGRIIKISPSHPPQFC